MGLMFTLALLLTLLAMMGADITQAFCHGDRYSRPRYLRPPRPACNTWEWGKGVWWRVTGPLYGY